MEQRAKISHIYPLLLILCCIYSCTYSPKLQDKKEVQADSLVTFNGIEMNRSSLDSLTSQLSNRVQLDTLLQSITQQQHIKSLAVLNDVQPDPEKLTITYSGGGYTFTLKTKGYSTSFPSSMSDENTIFYDGKKKIVFRNYKVTCYQEEGYEYDDFGFNAYHSLVDPEIVEVCGKRFLYSALGFACNGKGCMQQVTMIYDLQEKIPTFVSSYNLPFTNFLLSDFDNDGVPNLLVIAASEEMIPGDSNVCQFRMKLLAYTYDRGTFKLDKDNFYDLYTVENGWESPKIYFIENDSWFKNRTKKK